MTQTFELNSGFLNSARQQTHYLECGPADGPLMFFLHGWPGISLMWRAQMVAFAADGWRCVAPDLRGYGQSFKPDSKDAYTIENIVADMVELHDHLGGKPAVWVGHDWGSVVVGDLAAHEAQRCRAAVLTSLAYFPEGHALNTVVPLVDRSIYPLAEYPDGQWDYYRYYTVNFESAVADLDADVRSSLASIFRRGDPQGVGKVSPNAMVTRKGGRFGDAHRAPLTEPDLAIWPPEDFAILVESFQANGFWAPCAWYLNDAASLEYARRAPDHGRLLQPVLFINGDYDQICTVTANRQGEPMRAVCTNLSEVSLPAGHWLPLELKNEQIAVIRHWLKSNNLA